MSQVLSRRALNRATLARQMLLRRARIAPILAVERLAGLQAQIPRPPFVGLWSRLESFSRAALTAPMLGRELVRGTLMRATLHLVSRADFWIFRHALTPMFAAQAGSWLRKELPDLDPGTLLDAARGRFRAGPCTFEDVRQDLRARFPGANDRAMGYVVRLLLPTVQVPEPGLVWAYPARARFAAADDWVSGGKTAEDPAACLALRYFAAFGPASARDFQTWSGLGATKPILARIRPQLRAFRDEDGRELFDVPRAPRPDPDEEAPVRFLPEYDNLIIGYADRTRLVAPQHEPALKSRNLLVPATCLVDGMLAGTWRVDATRLRAVLTVTPVGKLSRRARAAIGDEAERLVRFVEPEAPAHDVVVQP